MTTGISTKTGTSAKDEHQMKTKKKSSRQKASKVKQLTTGAEVSKVNHTRKRTKRHCVIPRALRNRQAKRRENRKELEEKLKEAEFLPNLNLSGVHAYPQCVLVWQPTREEGHNVLETLFKAHHLNLTESKVPEDILIQEV